MPVIGLTGNIASGKSTVADRLQELGAGVIDADIIARDLVRPGSPAWQMIVDVFGEGYLLPNGHLNRKKLGDLIFTDPRARKDINEIIHPRVVASVKKSVEEFRADPANREKALVVQVPLLFEVGLNKIMDEVWLVTVNPQEQLTRLVARNRLTEQEALDRIEAQEPPAKKIPLVDRVIDTSGSVEDTLAMVDRFWRDIFAD